MIYNWNFDAGFYCRFRHLLPVPDCLPFVFGVLLGSAASIVKVMLLERL